MPDHQPANAMNQTNGTRRCRAGTSALLAGVFFLFFGCVATPVPEPPDLAPPDTDLMSVSAMTGFVASDVTITGAPGAAEPGSTLTIVDIDSTRESLRAEVGPDGSFDVTVVSDESHRLRVQLRNDEGARSAPLDLVVPAVGDAGPPRVARYEECLLLDPALELDFGGASVGESRPATIIIRNDCGSELRIAALTLRMPNLAFTVTTATPLVVNDGSGSAGEVRYEPPATGADEFEEILLIDVTEPFIERRPLTLFGSLATD